MKDKTAKNIERLKYLSSMIVKYTRNRKSGAEPSDRTYKWISEYETIKESDRTAWEKYCNETNACFSHDGNDLLA